MYTSSPSGGYMTARAARLWDKTNRKCLVCGDTYSPVRSTQKYCPPPKRCRYSNKAKVLSRNNYVSSLTCRDCKENFTPRASNQVTCGTNCPGKKPSVKRCANVFCDKKFTVTRQVSPTRQIYCSLACNKKEEVFRKYKMTSRDYMKMLTKQGGVCLGCAYPPAEGQRLHVDHDRSCCPDQRTCGKCVRGLVHLECNIAEGLFKDNPERLLKLAQYMLEK